MALSIPVDGEQAAGLLRRTELRKFLIDAEVKELGRHCKASTRKTGAVVFREGDPAGDLYWLVEGAVELRARPPGRRAYRTVELVDPGCIFGEDSLFGEGAHLFGARTLQPTRLLVLARSGFERLADARPEIAIGILQCAGSCLVEIVRRAAILTQAPAEVGLRQLLKEMAPAPRNGEATGRTARIRLTHSQIAGVLHLSRETVSRMLGKMADQGEVELSRGVIRIRSL